MNTGLTSTHTARGFSLLYQACSLENNAFSDLNYVISVALHYYMFHRFDIFSAPGIIAHGSIRLPPRSLASLRGCSFAIKLRGLVENKLNILNRFWTVFRSMWSVKARVNITCCHLTFTVWSRYVQNQRLKSYGTKGT